MENKCIDCIGQEVELGDWCAVTQHNAIYVGKVIKAGTSVTIACSSQDEFLMTNSKFKKIKVWKNKVDYMKRRFGPDATPHTRSPSWARDGKFIKISPTPKMQSDYDV
tara:strand:+ start:1514 stop:1837 length:324 start_codon:yes stop_codon:yes gene_type:complete